MRTKLVLGIYLAAGVVSIVIGTRYFLSAQFMSYHAQAVGTSWQEVESGYQTLILALMKVAGAGWITLGFFSITLASAAFRTGTVVARWLLPIGTIIFWFGSFSATWGVYQATGASTPWGPSLLMIGIAVLALVIDSPWSSQLRGNAKDD